MTREIRDRRCWRWARATRSLRCSTSPAIRAGAGSRRPSARIRGSSAQMGIAYVRGIQSDGLATGVAATGKHFVGYGGVGGWAQLGAGPSRRSRAARRLRLPLRGGDPRGRARHRHERLPRAGRRAVRRLAGAPDRAAARRAGLRRRRWSPTTSRSTHCTATTASAHDKGDAARLALEAGLDVELPALDCFGAPLAEAIARGDVPVGLVDRAVRRHAAPQAAARALRAAVRRCRGGSARLRHRAAAGVGARARPQVDRPAEERRWAAAAAERSRGASPSSGRRPTPSACFRATTTTRRIWRSSSAPSTSMRPRLRAAPAQRVNLADHFPPMVSLLDGIRAAVAPGTAVVHARGCDLVAPGDDGFAAAVAAAVGADAAICCVGGKSGLVDGCTSGEAVDRSTLGLPGVQQRLVEAIVATGTPTVVVLVDGRPLALPWIADARAGRPARLAAGRGGRPRGGRRAVRRRRSGRASPGLDAARGGAGAGVPRPQAVGRRARTGAARMPTARRRRSSPSVTGCRSRDSPTTTCG